MAFSPHGGIPIGPSGLDPSGGFELPDVDSLDTAAANLTTHSAAFRSGIDSAARTWSGLGSSYVSEESPTVLAAFSKVSPLAGKVSTDAQQTSQALTAFSSTCRELRQRLEALGRSVRDLDSDIAAFPTSVEKTTMVKGEQVTTQVKQSWHGEADLTARHDTLSADLKAIHNDYVSAQNTCAAALAAISGADVHTVSHPAGTDRRTGNWVDDWLWDAGTLFGIDHNGEEQPWGSETVPYRLNGDLGLLQGLGAGAIGLVDGVWSMTFTGNQAKRDQVWGGMNALNAAAWTLAATPLSAFDQDRKDREAPAVQKALDLFLSMGPAFVYADEANTNPNWAAGGATFNIGTLLLSRGASSQLKAGSLASKAGLAAERLSVVTKPRLGVLSAALGSTANGLGTAGTFLSKPGSLALKVSDIVMPETTAKVMDNMTKMRVGFFTAMDTAKAATAENLAGAKHAVATGLAATADGIRTVDDALPRTDFALANGAVTHTSGPIAADWLDNHAASIRANNPPAFTPPKATAADTGSPVTSAATELIRPEPFTRPEHVTNTVVLGHGDGAFPIHRKENFAARTGLKPNTEYIIEHRSLMKNESSVVDRNTVEKYYTDKTGTVTRVDTYAGVKGAWSPELNKPLPNVTYNVVAQVDGGLQNTFTIVTDNLAKAKSIEAHITGTLKGDMNRNGWQQLLAGKRVGGPDYEGGHLIASLFGGPGERANLLAQHMFQNRGKGAPNVDDNSLAFFQLENDMFKKVQHRIDTGQPIDLHMKVEAVPGPKAGLPDGFDVTHWFDSEKPAADEFSNLPKSEKVMN